MERLLRRIMALPKQPAVVMMHHMTHNMVGGRGAGQGGVAVETSPGRSREMVVAGRGFA